MTRCRRLYGLVARIISKLLSQVHKRIKVSRTSLKTRFESIRALDEIRRINEIRKLTNMYQAASQDDLGEAHSGRHGWWLN